MDTNPPDVRWLTLKELADARRISVSSAARLVRRRKWRRQPGNDGHVRVAVPVADAEVPEDARPDVPDPVILLGEALVMLREQLAASATRVAAAESRAEVAESRAEAAEAELARLRAGGVLRRAWRAIRRR